MKEREHKIEWPLYPELFTDYSANKHKADRNSRGGDGFGETGL